MSEHINVDWSEKATVEGQSVSIGTADSRWFASSEKPYFCFEGEDRLEVIDLASRALRWYRDKPTTPAPIPHERSTTEEL